MLPKKLGRLPKMYPQNKLDKLKHFSDLVNDHKDDASQNSAKSKKDYKDLLAKVAQQASHNKDLNPRGNLM